MTTNETPTIDHGAVRDIPLNRLKRSPRNARKMPHSADAVAALAASIAVKGMLQTPVVEPELTEDGVATGFFLVTIGEGRRQAQLLRAKRKEIKKTEPVRCIIDTAHDAHEISLDENITRSAMHPADQFEAFQRLTTDQGLGAEEIGARFGVSSAVVRQRLRLASVSPRLIQAYREDALTLDQLMAFSITEDHARQEQVWETIETWEQAVHIRRRLMEDRVRATDRRAVFVGMEAYEAAGGVVERDLFADDHGGYLTNVPLLERLVVEKLDAAAAEVLAEGWKWALAGIDRHPVTAMPRVYPEVREFTLEEQARYDSLQAQAVALEGEPQTPEVESQWTALSEELDGLDAARTAFSPEARERSGVFVSLTPEGAVRIERGFVRPEDAVAAPDEEQAEGEDEMSPKPDASDTSVPSPVSDKVMASLTAHRTAALRDAVAQAPETAVFALLHAMILRTFAGRASERSCMEVRVGGVELRAFAPEIATSRAAQAIAERHERWAARIAAAESAEAFVGGLDATEALALLAHCASLTVNDVQTSGRWTGDRPAARLASKIGLDMKTYWTPTAESYFGQVNKSVILQAVGEAVSPDAARRIATAKKTEMAEAAEQLIAGTGWLPEPLRTEGVEAPSQSEAA